MGRLAIIEEAMGATANSSDQADNKTTQTNSAASSRKACASKGVSDESGYYEDGEELPNDDSIEIVYVNPKTTAKHEVSITPILDHHHKPHPGHLKPEQNVSATSAASQGKP